MDERKAPARARIKSQIPHVFVCHTCYNKLQTHSLTHTQAALYNNKTITIITMITITLYETHAIDFDFRTRQKERERDSVHDSDMNDDGEPQLR